MPCVRRHGSLACGRQSWDVCGEVRQAEKLKTSRQKAKNIKALISNRRM